MSNPLGAVGGLTGPDPDRYLEVTWQMVGELSRALAVRVARDYSPELVVGIARAGVIPGATIASILQVDFHSMLITRHVHGEPERARPSVLSAAPAACRGHRVLLVDEITTSGETFRLALAAVRDAGAAEVRTATAFVRPGGYRPDYHSLETDETIINPWDRKVFVEGELVVNPRYRAVIDE